MRQGRKEIRQNFFSDRGMDYWNKIPDRVRALASKSEKFQQK
jgi:hypothetical protein